MKEIKEAIYHEPELDIDIRCYLSNAEAQSIANAVAKSKTWAERQSNIDMLLLHFCTNIGDKECEEIGYDMLQRSGTIDIVKEHIYNIDLIYDAIEYNENIARALVKLMPKIEKAVKQNATNTISKK